VALGALHVRESHCLTDGRFLALFRSANSDAPNQVRADFVWLKAVFAFLPRLMPDNCILVEPPGVKNVPLTISNSWIGGGIRYGYIGNENLLGRLALRLPRQLGNWEVNSRESAEERRESLAVRTWKGY